MVILLICVFVHEVEQHKHVGGWECKTRGPPTGNTQASRLPKGDLCTRVLVVIVLCRSPWSRPTFVTRLMKHQRFGANMSHF